MLPKLFSRRNAPPRDSFVYEVSEQAKRRLFSYMLSLTEMPFSPGSHNFYPLAEEIGYRCNLEYGGLLHRPDFNGGFYDDPDIMARVTEHWMICDADKAVDFLEMFFHAERYEAGDDGVKTINGVLREEGIGIEFSPYQVFDETEPGERRQIRIEYPLATKKTNELVHSETIIPALTLLAGKEWKVADSEMRDAHRAFREGRFEDANTACGRSFETVLKTICTAKKWSYDPHKDTLAALVDICRANGLFPPFYMEIFKASGRVRNSAGGHGKGPTPLYVIDERLVAHMIQMTSAHIVLLAKLAGMA